LLNFKINAIKGQLFAIVFCQVVNFDCGQPTHLRPFVLCLTGWFTLLY
jgi:hypothetical protein